MDAFSGISDLSDNASIPEGPSITSQISDSITQSSINPTGYLASIVQRGMSLCKARRSLEEDILRGLESREKQYLDVVEGATASLAMARRDAVDSVARLKDASGEIISITLPWLRGVERGVHGGEKNSPSLTPSPLPITDILALLVTPCPTSIPLLPVPVVVSPILSLLISFFSTMLHDGGRFSHIRCVSLSGICIHFPTTWSPRLRIHSKYQLASFRRCFPDSYKRPSDSYQIACHYPDISNTIPTLRVKDEYREEYQGGGSQSAQHAMAGSILNLQFPLALTEPSLCTTAFQANLREFINSYSQWKK